MISYEKARLFCYEDISKIENYALAMTDKTQVWHLHHRLEITMNCCRKALMAKDCYYHRPAHELIFLTKADHTRLHNVGNKYRLGRKASDEFKHRIAKVLLNRQDLSKSVRMTRLSDGFSKVFPSMAEAERWLRENGYPKAHCSRVSHCANGHRATTYGAKWRFVDA